MFLLQKKVRQSNHPTSHLQHAFSFFTHPHVWFFENTITKRVTGSLSHVSKSRTMGDQEDIGCIVWKPTCLPEDQMAPPWWVPCCVRSSSWRKNAPPPPPPPLEGRLHPTLLATTHHLFPKHSRTGKGDRGTMAALTGYNRALPLWIAAQLFTTHLSQEDASHRLPPGPWKNESSKSSTKSIKTFKIMLEGCRALSSDPPSRAGFCRLCTLPQPNSAKIAGQFCSERHAIEENRVEARSPMVIVSCSDLGPSICVLRTDLCLVPNKLLSPEVQSADFGWSIKRDPLVPKNHSQNASLQTGAYSKDENADTLLSDSWPRPR